MVGICSLGSSRGGVEVHVIAAVWILDGVRACCRAIVEEWWCCICRFGSSVGGILLYEYGWVVVVVG